MYKHSLNGEKQALEGFKWKINNDNNLRLFAVLL